MKTFTLWYLRSQTWNDMETFTNEAPLQKMTNDAEIVGSHGKSIF